MSDRIALLLCGHIRNFNIKNYLRNDFDIFVFAWDNIGLKGNETKFDDSSNPKLVENQIKELRNLKSYKIENNLEFIKNNQNTDIKYFNHSSPEVFIKSQLYSVYQCYKLMEEYSNKNNERYRMVIKSRMDCDFLDFRVDEQLFSDIEKNIIFVTNQDCEHTHSDYGTGCYACDTMYYRHKLRHPHIFEHTNVVCDLFAYGSMKSMKDYCFLYEHYDDMNKEFEEENFRSLKRNPQIKPEITNNVYRVTHTESLYYFNCSYPERMLPKLLKDYMLVSSDKIRMRFNR